MCMFFVIHMFTSVNFYELLDRIDDFYLNKLNLKEKSPYLYEDIYKASYAVAYFVQNMMSDRKDSGRIGCVTGGILMATKDLFANSKGFLNSFMSKDKLEGYGLCDSRNIENAYKKIKRDTRGKSLGEFLELYLTESARPENNRMLLKFEPKPESKKVKEFLPYESDMFPKYKKRKL